MIPTAREYVSTSGSLEIGVWEDSFQAGFWVPIHLFIEGFLGRYSLMLA